MKTSSTDKVIKSLTSIPGWQQQLLNDVGGFDNSIESVSEAFSHVPIVYRGVKMRADALSSVPAKVKSGENEIDWPYPCDLRQLIWNIEADLLGAGKAVILKLRNRTRVLDLMRLNPFTVGVRADNSGRLTFSQNGQQWPQEDIIFIKEFSYSDDLTGGVSTVQACLNDAALMNYQTRFASRFFEGGAMPMVVWSADGIISDDETKRIQKFFNSMSGIAHAFRNLFLRTKVTPNVISQDLDKMTLPDLYSQATRNIANAFGIPATMFMGDDNYASADSHRMAFWQDVIRPRAKLVESALNRQLLNAMGMEFEFAFDEMDIFQEDEVERANAFATYVNAGLNPLVVIEMLGIDVPEGVDPLAPKPEPEPIVITAQETQEPAPNPLDEELGKWQKKALKRVKDGKAADCSFESEIIPAGMQAEIHEALKLCHDEEEVKSVFDGTYEHSGMADLLFELRNAIEAVKAEPEPDPEQKPAGRVFKMDTPQINITVPEQPAPIVNVNVPEQPVPIVNVAAPVVNIPEQPINVTVPAPVVNVSVPQQEPPTVNVNVPEKDGKLVVHRNSRGEITSIDRS